MPKPIGIQLYTLRPDVYPAGSDLPGVLKTVAEIGYRGVEFAGLHGSDPKELGKIVSDLGMVVSSSHTGLPTPENVRQMADVEAALGNKRIISGRGPNDFATLDKCKETIAQFRQAAEILKPYGMEFGIHNHWWEFNTLDGRYVYDIIMEEAPDIFSELDVYWCEFAKASAVEIIRKYTKRQPLLHIKDGMLTEIEGSRPHTAIGSGKLDMPAIIGAADPDALEWVIVELDNCDTDMLEAVKESYRYLTSTDLAEGRVKN